MTKKRVPIPAELATEVLFASDRTCCICNERGKAIQIHHIDENPSNNIFENLCVVCLECHNQTQTSGGFGRKLNKELVIKYRNEWLERVQKRRIDSDKLAVSKIIGDTSEKTNKTPEESVTVETLPYSVARSNEILEYVKSLPELKKELENKAQPEYDTGVTARVVNASYEYIDALEGILVKLASFYPYGTFGKNPHEFFSEQISLRFKWHRSYAEPYGPGTGGTIVNILVVSSVRYDVSKMIEDMVMTLASTDSFDWRSWRRDWKGKIYPENLDV